MGAVGLRGPRELTCPCDAVCAPLWSVLCSDPSGLDVLILEDLIDTGTTLAWLRHHLGTKRCASVTICCLLDKTARRTADVKVDFVGFHIPDEFVVGYGMDFNDSYRCLPYIAVLKPEAYSKGNE